MELHLILGKRRGFDEDEPNFDCNILRLKIDDEHIKVPRRYVECKSQFQPFNGFDIAVIKIPDEKLDDLHKYLGWTRYVPRMNELSVEMFKKLPEELTNDKKSLTGLSKHIDWNSTLLNRQNMQLNIYPQQILSELLNEMTDDHDDDLIISLCGFPGEPEHRSDGYPLKEMWFNLLKNESGDDKKSALSNVMKKIKDEGLFKYPEL